MTIIVGEPGPVDAGEVAGLQDPSIIANGLLLTMTDPDPIDGYLIEVLGDDLEPGDPEAVIAAIQSQLQDGDAERIDRFGNRQASIPLQITAPDHAKPGAAIAAGQLALELACRFEGFAELEWTSCLAGAETSVIEMTTAVVEKNANDLDEAVNLVRYFTLSIHARPFVRPAENITFDAPPVIGSTVEPVDDGSSATGWSLLSTAPDPARNLVPNPGFEVNTTGWAAGAGSASIARTTVSPYAGTAALRVNCGSDGAAVTSWLNGPGPCAIVGGSTYTIRAAFLMANPTATGPRALLRWYSDVAGTTQVGSDVSMNSAVLPYATWGVRSWTATAPATAVSVRLFFGALASSSGFVLSDYWMMDSVTLSNVTYYFDGGTADTAAITYNWDGTANNSTSTGTWTAPALASVSGAVTGTVYGRASASISRTNTGITATDMGPLPYIRIRGTASAFSDGQVTVADDDGSAIAPLTSSYSAATGDYEILVYRPAGFAALEVTFSRTGGTISTTDGLFVAVDSIEITDNPVGTGRVQVRQIDIEGSQRTELSLSVLGLDATGTTPEALGEQVLIHSASVLDDRRSKFVPARTTSGRTGTPDTTAVSGFYDVLGVVASPTVFTLNAADLLPGSWLIVPRLKPITTGAKTISFAAALTSGVVTVSDPVSGWSTCPLAVDAPWPGIPLNEWRMIPLGYLRLPPADVEDPAATVDIKLAASAASAVQVDEVFLVHATSGELTLLNLADGVSAVRLDAANVNRAQPSAWVGTANGPMMQVLDQDFSQHQAVPRLLSVASVAPGCPTTRLSGHYPPNYGHDVAPRKAAKVAALLETGGA